MELTPKQKINRFKQEIAFKLTPIEATHLEDIANEIDYDFNTMCEKLDLKTKT